MANPVSVVFNAAKGLCQQGGYVAIELTAAKETQIAFVEAGLFGSDEQLNKAAQQKLPSCKNSMNISNMPYKGPGGR